MEQYRAAKIQWNRIATKQITPNWFSWRSFLFLIQNMDPLKAKWVAIVLVDIQFNSINQLQCLNSRKRKKSCFIIRMKMNWTHKSKTSAYAKQSLNSQSKLTSIHSRLICILISFLFLQLKVRSQRMKVSIAWGHKKHCNCFSSLKRNFGW